MFTVSLFSAFSSAFVATFFIFSYKFVSFTESAISFLLAKFAGINAASKFPDVNLLNS